MPEPIPIVWGRPTLPLAGPVAAAMDSRRFAPLPGFTPLRESQFVTGHIDDIHTIYGGLRSGRLVIAGAPGAGKSGAAVLFVLAALRHRDRVSVEERTKVPVPILLTAQDWDPRRQSLKDWLIRRLQLSYPLFAGQSGTEKVSRMIDVGKLTMIFDGLDEMAEELRPIALQALNYASFRVIILSRTAEMASAASHLGRLQGAAAIELHAVDVLTAASYLEHVQLYPPPAGWRDLIHRIRANPNSPLSEALNNPLTLTLIRDTYHSGDDARELLKFCDRVQRVTNKQAAEEITGYLLDRVLVAAYAPRPGQPLPKYNFQTAHTTLSRIAARMNEDEIRDLQWWRIPRWTSAVPRAVLGGFVAWLITGGIAFVITFVGLLVYGATQHKLTAGNAFLLIVGSLYGSVLYGFVAAVIVGAITWVSTHFSSNAPAKIASIRRPKLRQITISMNLKIAVRAGLLFGLVIGLAFGIPSLLSDGIVVALRQGSIGGLFGGSYYWHCIHASIQHRRSFR